MNSTSDVAIQLPSRARSLARVIDLDTQLPRQLLNITTHLHDFVAEAKLDSGLIHVQTLHTTTGLLINEWQSALLSDLEQFLEQLVPGGEAWRHNDPRYSDCQRSNAAAHLRALLLAPSLLLQVRRGRLVLGTWQNVIFAELDGPRSRAVSVALIPA